MQGRMTEERRQDGTGPRVSGEGWWLVQTIILVSVVLINIIGWGRLLGKHPDPAPSRVPSSARAPMAKDDTPPVAKPATGLRPLLYPADAARLSPEMRKLVDAIRNPQSPQIPPEQFQSAKSDASRIYARLVTRKFVLDGSRLTPTAMVGGRPYVFVAAPQTMVGRNLLQIYSAIGYVAEDVLLDELGQEKVILLLRWPQVLQTTDRPEDRDSAWDQRIYPATWDNLLMLLDRYARQPDRIAYPPFNGPAILEQLRLSSPQQREFVLGFPEAGKQRVRTVPYALLQAAGGADWEYRQILERAFSATVHYTGDGNTLPTLIRRGTVPKGFPEFLAPNRKLTELEEVAIIGVGSLNLTEQPSQR
ncbi:hypothetical protein [Tuwongella immobilis]|uniref:Uncharacterized protein n=1 Tax=Tuwongella immobilis TaxID=692036 RepID=A0A6C2YK53_9BACT|nr:hypothetical protein [Tuwongella immobilis]VIP01485.1 Uncharacterized protein OS=Beggiatoa alba B18LD GN=BegalDRAFT_3558 PE=4 SV=1 [Tuwongella immobilis]VTR98547.1 Uncharacterized protein OS=Beggiatoa alba B18LD GN=BegalDRAFT_3558 PE=4 SV=1 [Tuwongella immobilis]